MKLTYTKKIVKRRNKELAIIIPDNIDGFLNNCTIFDADRKGLNSILMSALIMMKEKNIVVYFPLQKNEIEFYWAKGKSFILGEKEICDVVFMHHSTQTPISDWKEIKQSLKYSKSVREHFEADINFECDMYEKEYEKFEKSELGYKLKDVFSHHNRFDTCFFVGGLFSYMQLFIDLKDMLELPLEENFKNGKEADYIFFIDNYKKNGYDCPELGFFDKTLYKLRRK